MSRRLFVLAGLVVLAVSLAWGQPQTPSLRKLCIDAPTILLAEPVDPATPTSFKVVLVIRGKGVRAGDTLTPEGLMAGAVRTMETDPETHKPRPRRIVQALLFLAPGKLDKSKKAPAGPRVLWDGLRFCTDDGRVLAPTGEYGQLQVREQLRWPVLLQRVRADVATVEQLQSYRRMARPRRRTEALIDWVQRHRGEFAAAPVAGREDEEPAGWEDLQLAVFDWLLAEAAPADAWLAVKLYAELNRGDNPRLSYPTFSTPEGRKFLLDLARNASVLFADRARALQVLGAPITLWPTNDEMKRGAKPVTAKEQETLLEQLAGLLDYKEESFGVAVARAIVRLSRPENKTYAEQRNASKLPALIAAYKSSRPGPARDELSAAVYALASPSQWKEVSGNPPGVCASLADLERKHATVTFWLTLQPSAPTIYEAPVMVVEKLNTFGFVSQTTRVPLGVLNLERPWAQGWKPTEPLATRQDIPNLVPSTTYRIRVEGFAGKGKDRRQWRSEPKRFVVPAARQSGSGPYSGPRYESKW
jgi:hypothetical protein